MEQLTGIICKITGGFYYVEAAESVYECKARGVFRKRGTSPLVGDTVDITVPNDGYCSIDKIHDRRNSLVRPALANLDNLMIISSVKEPDVNLYLIDKMTAAAVKRTRGDVRVWYDDDGVLLHVTGAEVPAGLLASLDPDAAQLICPASLGDGELREMQRIAARSFEAIGGAGLARVDFFLTDAGFVVNEINTMPGFTPISMFPSNFAPAPSTTRSPTVGWRFPRS